MKSIKFTLESSKIHLKFNINDKKITKQEFEKLIVKSLDDNTYDILNKEKEYIAKIKDKYGNR